MTARRSPLTDRRPPISPAAPWHKASFDRFLQERLPHLLADRVPLVSYHAEATGRYTCRITVVLASRSGDIAIQYPEVPQPDEAGIFEVDGVRRVVIPTASDAALDVAEIACVGEQLYDDCAERLGAAPTDLPWDESLARAWLPLDRWIREFLTTQRGAAQFEERNWLARCQHLRRLWIPRREKVFTPGYFGRVCPFEKPEGPNIWHIRHVAVGAEIRDGRLVVVDERPEAALGVGISMVPFLEHSDANRLLMGIAMMRQWMVPPDPEPALVQTGYEPDAPDFWCGRNLLTAYIPWGVGTFEDGIVISESCAKRLNYPSPVEPGDKLSNRHGTKGVVSRILPDAEMPHLSDGTPVELVFSVMGLFSRLNVGQVKEALMGRIARAEGAPVIVPPFHAPSEPELRERLASAGLPEDGLERLTQGRGGPPLQRPSAVGWVYWGRTYHVVQDKIMASVGRTRGQRQGEIEYYTLRDIAAYETITERFNTVALEREDVETLAERVAAGVVEPVGPPTPLFSNLQRRLAVAGIRATLEGDRLTVHFARPEGESLKLARPIPHPWLRDRVLDEVGSCEELARYRSITGAENELTEYHDLAEVNARIERMAASHAPDSLIGKAIEQLETRLNTLFETLLTPSHLRVDARAAFSGRSVIVPDEVRFDQVGLPDEIAWTLFAPLVTRELGNAEEVRTHSERAAGMLDRIMARSWVVVNRAPSSTPTTFLAFHPVRCPDRAIHVHPSVCELMNADFDGDQVAVFLPITAGAQQEAGERLSIAGHVRRDPGLVELLIPSKDALWGLASLSLTSEGRREIVALAGVEVATPDGFVTRRSLADAMRKVLERAGVDKTLEALERLRWRGFEVARASGASISPFIGASVQRPPQPETDDPEHWKAYREEFAARIASRTDFADHDLGALLLAVKSGARGFIDHLTHLAGSVGVVTDVSGASVPIRHGYAEGLTIREVYACVVGGHERMAQFLLDMEQTGAQFRAAHLPKGFNVLARAMRAQHPGIVFARAAATGEIDPLTDVDSRLFVGLPVKAHE